MSWAATLRRGSFAGLVGGTLAAVVMWWVVEPAIERAIALEGDDHGHGQGAGAGTTHEHAGEVVSRLAQQLGGTVTVLVVACILGLVFSAVYSGAQHRLPARSAGGRSLALASLAFTAHALVPALVSPANPPGVGDPATVDRRSLAWLMAIALSLLVILVVFSADRRLVGTTVSATTRVATVTGLGVLGLVLILLFAPRAGVQAPTGFPADLLWSFRLGSLGQLAAMWLGIAVAFGVSTARAEQVGHDHRLTASAEV